jgi:hypothetical protein
MRSWSSRKPAGTSLAQQKESIPPEIRRAQEEEIQQLIARFEAEALRGHGVAQLEVLVRGGFQIRQRPGRLVAPASRRPRRCPLPTPSRTDAQGPGNDPRSRDFWQLFAGTGLLLSPGQGSRPLSGGCRAGFGGGLSAGPGQAHLAGRRRRADPSESRAAFGADRRHCGFGATDSTGPSTQRWPRSTLAGAGKPARPRRRAQPVCQRRWHGRADGGGGVKGTARPAGRRHGPDAPSLPGRCVHPAPDR